MADSESSDCVGFCESQREADRHRAWSFVESARAQVESVLEPTELQSRNQFHRWKLPSNTSCNREQFLNVQHRVDDRYDLMDEILVSRAGMAKRDEHSRLTNAPCEQKNRN